MPAFVSSESSTAAAKLKMPKKVNSVLQDKCYMCHNSKAQSPKAVAGLNLDELTTLSLDKQLKEVQKIQRVVDNGSMPPGWFLKDHADKKLTDAEATTLKKWASKSVKKLSKKLK